jgi:oligoribonuclease NrnB/cAMP/cGMP phosphodiesterase (DHH superfamily)
MSANKALVLYHANCTDGFASAWAFSKTRAEAYEHVKYLPVSYGKGLEQVPVPDKNTDVFILDFSFNRDDLQNLSQRACSVLILDHHKTAQADLSDWKECPENVEIVFDMNRSGAGITWDYFTRHPRPKIIDYVEDRDLWKFTLQASVEMNAPILLLPFGDFEAFDKMAERIEIDPDGVVAAGELLIEQKDTYVKHIVGIARECSFELTDGTITKGLCSNCTFQFASDVGNKLAEKSGTFGATYFTDAEGNAVWSLRSNGEFDVSAIAKMFGGGGHRNAAGFKLFATDEDREGGIKVWKIQESKNV